METIDLDIMRRNSAAADYSDRVRRSRRDASRWWDTLVQRALACGTLLFILALLAALWATR